MSPKRLFAFGHSIALIAGTLLLSGCAKPANEATSNEPAPHVPSTIEPSARVLTMASPAPSPNPSKKPSTPPNPTEIRDTVARVFEKAAAPDTSYPGFAVGDFNGDGSEDLAVAIKPRENSLGELNNELANWLLEDPKSAVTPKAGSTARTPPPKPVRVEKGDTLLAIIHGVGSQGWRAPEARQTFVLKNGAGLNMVVQPAKALRDAGMKLLPVKGDVIKETIGTKSGFVFWTGAKYGWLSSSPE